MFQIIEGDASASFRELFYGESSFAGPTASIYSVAVTVFFFTQSLVCCLDAQNHMRLNHCESCFCWESSFGGPTESIYIMADVVIFFTLPFPCFAAVQNHRELVLWGTKLQWLLSFSICSLDVQNQWEKCTWENQASVVWENPFILKLHYYLLQ